MRSTQSWSHLINKNFKKWMSIAIICLCVFFVCMFIGLKHRSVKENNLVISDEEIHLVFEPEYYYRFNSDVAETIGMDELALQEHFRNYGMAEGRVASPYFDVSFYKANNADLASLYQDQWVNYYLHYVKYGYSEGRIGSKLDAIRGHYPFNIECKLTSEDNVEIKIDLINKEYLGKEYNVVELEPYMSDVEDGEKVYSGEFQDEIAISVPFSDINKKYVLTALDTEGTMCLSAEKYIENPEFLCPNTGREIIAPKSKKGLQISLTDIDDIEQLDPSYVFTNLIIEQIMRPESYTGPAIVYEYKGRRYYFDQAVIEDYDEKFSLFERQNRIVTASVVCKKTEGFEMLYYPEVEGTDEETATWAINTSTKQGQEYLEAFISFMSKRYSGENESYGKITNWVVGNEVNESKTYNYMGDRELKDYMKEYTRTYRIVYNIVKNNICNSNIYVPMEPWWGIDSNMLTYGGREFLDYFNEMMRASGESDWGLAYHAYSYPLSDPKVLNDGEKTLDQNGEWTLDGYVTTHSFNTVTISMENIDVLTDYMSQERFLNPVGQVRTIILSEQGYTANSNIYGKCEALQAASMVYAYYKAEMNENIDAFIYFVQKDTVAASLNNDYYLFGLSDINNHHRMAYDVYARLDSRNSIDDLGYIKTILGIENWNEIIDGFNEEHFLDMAVLSEDIRQRDLGKIDIDADNIKIQCETEIEFGGKECMPQVSVMFNDELLEEDRDYDVVFINNDKIGTATAAVVGMNKYKGVKKTEFIIK